MYSVNPIVQTGSLHVAIYELHTGIVYVAHSAGVHTRAASNNTGPVLAYDRPYIAVNTSQLVAEPRPQHARNGVRDPQSAPDEESDASSASKQLMVDDAACASTYAIRG